MARSFRSWWERYLVWQRAGGLCEICGKPLTGRWQIHHIVPYVYRARTNLYEVQAVHPKCNQQRGINMDRAEFWQWLSWAAARVGMREGLEIALARLADRKSYSAFVYPTRWGKSDFIRLVILLARHLGLTSDAVILEPNIYLRDQINKEKKIGEMLHRYAPAFWKGVLRCRAAATLPDQPILNEMLTPNGEQWVSMTMALANSRREQLVDWVRHRLTATGRPPLIFVDESHMGARGNEWGATATALADAGALIVLVTATPYRHDGDLPVGFEIADPGTDPEVIKFWRTRPHEDPTKLWLDAYTGQRTTVAIKPHHAVPFSVAWTQGYLCLLNRHEVDVALKDGRMLHDLKGPAARMGLSDAVRDRAVLANGVAKVLEVLTHRRRAGGAGRVTAMIFVGADLDLDEESPINDRLAKEVERAIKQQAPGLVTRICTTNVDRAAAMLTEYVTQKTIDVLILKNMGALGVDAEHCKVLGDFTPGRSLAAKLQLWSRAATPYGHVRTADIVIVHDAGLDELWKRAITDQGGDAVAVQSELLTSTVVDRKDPEERPQIDGATDGNVGDTHGRVIGPTQVRNVRDIIAIVPEIALVLTYPQIAERFADIDIVDRRPPVAVEDTGTERASFRNEADVLAKQLGHRRLRQVGFDTALWNDVMREVWNDAKRAVGISTAVKNEDLVDLAAWRRLVQWLRDANDNA